MIDYIADYLETIRDRRVYPNVHPGYLRNLTPDCAPVEPESWDHIMDDVENIVMPGVRRNARTAPANGKKRNCRSPFSDHALAVAANARLFSRAQLVPVVAGRHAGRRHQLSRLHMGKSSNVPASSSPRPLYDSRYDFQASSPACTELEIVVMNWLGKMIGLPETFLHTHNGSKGGGVIQVTVSHVRGRFITRPSSRTHTRGGAVCFEERAIRSRQFVRICFLGATFRGFRLRPGRDRTILTFSFRINRVAKRPAKSLPVCRVRRTYRATGFHIDDPSTCRPSGVVRYFVCCCCVESDF